MNINLTKIVNSNWFFLSVLCFAIALPLSQGFISIIAGVMFIVAVVEDNWQNKKQRLIQHKYLLFLPAIFLVYIISSVSTYESGESLYDLQKTLFYFVIPVAFVFGKTFTIIQQRILLFAFGVAIVISTWVGLVNWALLPNSPGFSVHNIGLISHIRFSFQLILIFWFFILFATNNWVKLTRWQLVLIIMLAVYVFAFLLFQQSLTGLVAFGSSIIFYLGYHVFQLKSWKRYLFMILLIIAVTFPLTYIAKVIHDFYDFEEVNINTIDTITAKGNLYDHKFESKLVENGNYVNLYLCEKEMREEWNKLSEIKYDSITRSGYPLSASLIRYLTSKGLRKDAEGILALSDIDRKNIENGISNVIFAQKKYSLYPRIYQTIWEYHIYSVTGNPNNQSFSQRIEFVKAALYIIKNNFWLGVGTGHWKEEFKNAYKENNSKLREELYGSSHNQYLNYMVKFGIIGLLLILFFIAYPVIKTKSYTNLLFALFLVFMAFANLADSNFESHMGSSFFVFFYCFFIRGSNNFIRLT